MQASTGPRGTPCPEPYQNPPKSYWCATVDLGRGTSQYTQRWALEQETYIYSISWTACQSRLFKHSLLKFKNNACSSNSAWVMPAHNPYHTKFSTFWAFYTFVKMLWRQLFLPLKAIPSCFPPRPPTSTLLFALLLPSNAPVKGGGRTDHR